VARATTVRFTDEIYARLDQASARTGMPVNSIVVAACLEWLARHVEQTPASPWEAGMSTPLPAAPRWATLRRALGQATSGGNPSPYPFERFTDHAKEMLKLAQAEANKLGHPYIGTEHLLLASFSDGSHSSHVLAALGVTKRAVGDKLESLVGREKLLLRQRMVPTTRVKKVIELAFGVAADSDRVGTEHILLALSKEGDGIAAHVLNDLGAPLVKIEREVASLKDPES
jgi:ClpA/ClpB-like protein